MGCENKPMSLSKLESTSSEITLAFNQSKFIELATKMRNEGKIKTDPEFAEKFMFAFENSPETFCVDLELLTEYKVYDKKGNAKRALTKNFTEGTDYQIEINCLSPERSGNQKASRGGNNKEIIMLTTECFKSMCVIAGSDAGRTSVFTLFLVNGVSFSQFIGETSTFSTAVSHAENTIFSY